MANLKFRIKEQWNAFQRVNHSFQQLQQSITNLQNESADLVRTLDALQRAVQRYQFKNQPHVKRINEILNH